MPRETEEELFKRLTRDARAEARREQQHDLERRRQLKLERRQKREDAARRQQQEEIAARREGMIMPIVEVRRRGIVAKPRKKTICSPAHLKMDATNSSGDRKCMSPRRDSRSVSGPSASAVPGGSQSHCLVSVRADSGDKVRDFEQIDTVLGEDIQVKESCGRGIMVKPRKKICLSVLGEAEEKMAEVDCVAESASVPARRDIGILTDPESPGRVLARVDAAIARQMSLEGGSEWAEEVEERCDTARDACQPEVELIPKESAAAMGTDWEEAWRQALTQDGLDSGEEVVAAWSQHMS